MTRRPAGTVSRDTRRRFDPPAGGGTNIWCSRPPFFHRLPTVNAASSTGQACKNST